MRKIFASIFSALSWLVYIVVAVALLIAAPLILGNRPVIVLSGSMEPAFPVGSIIYYKQADFEDIAVGDAITFRIGSDSLATHRVLEKDEQAYTFVTKGDANPSEDSKPIAYNDVVGKIGRAVLPYMGYLTAFIQNWYVIGAMALVLLLNMLLSPTHEETPKKGEQSMTETACSPIPVNASTAAEAAKAPRKRTKKRKITAEEYFSDF